MVVKLTRVDLQLKDIPAKLREVADELNMGIPEGGQRLAADRLYNYAQTIDVLVMAYQAREERR